MAYTTPLRTNLNRIKGLFGSITILSIFAMGARAGDLQRWSEKAANDWYAGQP
jgi:hypothetical protein